MFEVIKRSGLARVGKWNIDKESQEVNTPNILFLKMDEIDAPEKAEINHLR
jgi:hypothetical protein